MCLPYAAELLSRPTPGHAFAGIRMLQGIIARIPKRSVVARDIPLVSRFHLSQAWITSMVECPSQAYRSAAHTLFPTWLEAMADPAHFTLVKALLKRCPHVEVNSFLLDRLRKEMVRTWGTTSTFAGEKMKLLLQHHLTVSRRTEKLIEKPKTS